MKKIIFSIVSLIFFIVLSLNVFASEYPNPTERFFVNDFADVIDDNDEQSIMSMCEDLYHKSGDSTQVVVVTVKSLDGKNLETYSKELFRKWGIGSKEKNDGLLFLLSTGERQSRIEVGYGLEGIITDGKSGRIQDNYMIPFYKENDFSKGLVNGVGEVVKLIVEANNLSEVEVTQYEEPEESMLEIIMMFVLLLGISIAIFIAGTHFSMVRKCKICKGRKFKREYRKSTTKTTITSTCLKCGKVYKNYIFYGSSDSTYGGGSGGSFGGGSGFSGGDGSTGGGGSSRSF